MLKLSLIIASRQESLAEIEARHDVESLAIRSHSNAHANELEAVAAREERELRAAEISAEYHAAQEERGAAIVSRLISEVVSPAIPAVISFAGWLFGSGAENADG